MDFEAILILLGLKKPYSHTNLLAHCAHYCGRASWTYVPPMKYFRKSCYHSATQRCFRVIHKCSRNIIITTCRGFKPLLLQSAVFFQDCILVHLTTSLIILSCIVRASTTITFAIKNYMN